MPGVLSRLAAKTGVKGLLGLPLARGLSGKLPMALRDLLWYDGAKRPAPKIVDSLLVGANIFRMKSGRVVIAGKGGHNREPHNHNDVGSFVVHAGGEDLLCDPGSARYDRWYFTERRYSDYVQAMSLGHSVPAVAGRHQAPGRAHSGKVTAFDVSGRGKSVEIEFARAYDVKALSGLRRRIDLAPGGRFSLSDEFGFRGRRLAVDEAFVTRFPVKVSGRTARIRGEKSELALTITAPDGAAFALEKHPTTSQREPGGGTLHRIVAKIPASRSSRFSLEGRVSRR